MVPMGVRVAMLAATALLAACVTKQQAPVPAPAKPPAESSDGCDASKAAFAQGEMYSDELAQRARQASGARTVRSLRPGQPVTMEYRYDRLNLELSQSGRIESVRCG